MTLEVRRFVSDIPAGTGSRKYFVEKQRNSECSSRFILQLVPRTKFQSVRSNLDSSIRDPMNQIANYLLLSLSVCLVSYTNIID